MFVLDQAGKHAIRSGLTSKWGVIEEKDECIANGRDNDNLNVEPTIIKWLQSKSIA